jgi:hypothetical protein
MDIPGCIGDSNPPRPEVQINKEHVPSAEVGVQDGINLLERQSSSGIGAILETHQSEMMRILEASIKRHEELDMELSERICSTAELVSLLSEKFNVSPHHANGALLLQSYPSSGSLPLPQVSEDDSAATTSGSMIGVMPIDGNSWCPPSKAGNARVVKMDGKAEVVSSAALRTQETTDQPGFQSEASKKSLTRGSTSFFY